ncbi:MAG TPA: TonB-dependent receptor [Gemmatimonadaceae bacterium]
MRFRCRRTPAVAAWLLLAASLFSAGVGQAQEPSRAHPANSTFASLTRVDAPRQETAPRMIAVDLRDTPLESALSTIARLGQLRLTFSRDVLPMDRRVTLRASAISPVEALRAALQGTSLEVRVSVSGDVTIFPLGHPGSPEAQGVIEGVVTDSATGSPLADVLVRIEGTALTARTRGDGRFTLGGVPEGTYTVQARLLGYAPQRQSVTVTGDATVTVHFVLPRTAARLENVVVIGYGTQERRELTGSISSVSGDEIGNVPAPTVSSALQGRAAGLDVVSSGVPGSDASFRIRGITTIGNSNPLIVIDGVPTMSGVNELNPGDIASVEVLKDASAAAIYGSRGANGVVIITTKTGSKDGLRFHAYGGVQQVPQMVQMLDAASFAQLHNEMMQNAGRPTNPAFTDPASLGRGTDWLGALVRQSPVQSYMGSYSAASDRSKLYVSGSMLRQDGVILNTGFERYTLQLNSDSRVRDWLSFGNNLTLNHDVNRSGNYNIQAAMGAEPTQPILNPDGTYSGPVGRSEWAGDIVNPIGQASLIRNSTDGYNLIGSVHGDVRFTDHLSFRTNLGLQANFWNSRTWSPKYDWQPSPQEQSYLGEQDNRSTTWLADNTLTYDRQIADAHHVKLMVGTSAQANHVSFMKGSVEGFQSDRTQELSNGILPPTLGGSESRWGLLSFMGRANYSYNDTYLLTATLRRDGSSRFGDGRKWGLFPSIAGAWRISNEPFFPKSGHIDDLKLRVGYGETGNQEIGNYAFASVLQTVQYNFGGNLVSAVVPNVMPNPQVHWETVKQLDFGLDATAFDRRVRLTLDGYVKNTTGMLVPMSVPVTTGYSDIETPFINAGRIQNRGFEATLSTDVLRGRVGWTTDLVFATNRNRVLSLNDTVPLPIGWIDFNYMVGRIQAGHPMNAFYGFVTNGVFQSQEEVDAYAVQVPGADPYSRTSPGDIRFVDLNDDGVINDADRTFIGDPNPDFTFSIGNSISVGKLDVHLMLQGVVGNDVFNANRIWTEGMSSARNQTTAVEHRWTGPGTSNSMPRAVFGDPNGNSRASDRYIEDGSYLRVKELTVGYELPGGVARRLNASTARVYLAARNLLTLTGYSGFDPEVGIDGIDNNVYPVARTLSVGVDLAF